MQRDEALTILAAHRQDLESFGVKSIALFGSVARNEARPDSDVDVLFQFAMPVGYFELIRLERRLVTCSAGPSTWRRPAASSASCATAFC